MHTNKLTQNIRYWLLAALLALALLAVYKTFPLSHVVTTIQPSGPALAGPGDGHGNGG